MRLWYVLIAMIGLQAAGLPVRARGASGNPDSSEPGDAMIQAWLDAEAEKLHARFLKDVESTDDWTQRRPGLEQEYLYMLGLEPLPEKTPLHAAVTGSFAGDGFTVEMVHYQSKPRLYVTGNLYRPAVVGPGQRLPAVLQLCGHTGRGRNGCKIGYQPHGIWFARHGYICLVIDTLQRGEIAGFHRGTYSKQWWWWHARGYTPAGVECWNGVRGIDYLISRPDVDPERIAVTGISGGGAATFWVAAADDRVKVAVPVSGMADLLAYVSHRKVDVHCDCMFMYNTFGWPWARIAALIAPRALLFVNSTQDRFFPMDANERIINRLERSYALYGAGDRVDCVLSVGGHAYRRDIRQAVYRCINLYLKGDPSPVNDTEVDLLVEKGSTVAYPIPPEKLRVFPEDSDLPADQLNSAISRHFVPMANVEVPGGEDFDGWRRRLMAELRRVSFRPFPDRIPKARHLGDLPGSKMRMASEEGIEFRLIGQEHEAADPIKRVLLVVTDPSASSRSADWLKRVTRPDDLVYYCDTRGVGDTRWTRKNPPNYVERSHVLLGRTVDTGRVWDVAAAARFLNDSLAPAEGVHAAGQGTGGVLAAYATLFEPDISAVTLVDPPVTHMDDGAPQFLNVLRVCDIPDCLGMLAPRPVTVIGKPAPAWEKVESVFAAAGCPDMFARNSR